MTNSADSPQSTNDDYSSLLAAYHESLVKQGSKRVDARVQEELGGAIECLLMMERNRQLTAVALDTDSTAQESQSTLDRRPKDFSARTQDVSTSASRIGRFEIKRTLGAGGSGIVLLAHDPRLRRDVALKVPKPDALLSEEFVERFDREARIAANLKHPNIVSVLESGSIGPIHYIATDYCNGPNLRHWIREQEGGVSPQSAASMIRDLADALRHAHNRGVLHRDIKPSNILFDASDTGIAVRLADFGLAKNLADSVDVTSTAAVIGTPAYMAPEQAAGETADVGTHSDIFSLGVVLYELLTGVSPFERQTPLSTLEAVRNLEIASLESESGSVVPSDLETICLKCLQKKPADRYINAAELVDDLNSFLQGKAVHSPPVPFPIQVWRFVIANPVAVSLLLGLIGLLFTNGLLLKSRSEFRDDLVAMTESRDETRTTLFRSFLSREDGEAEWNDRSTQKNSEVN